MQSNESFAHCPTAEYWEKEVPSSNPDKPPYTVRYSRHHHNNPDVSHAYSCTCPSFHKWRTCRHIRELEELTVEQGGHCGWLQFIEGGEPVEKDAQKCCPECGAGPVEFMNWLTHNPSK